MSGTLLHLLRHGAPETPGLLLGRTDAAPTREGIAACVQQGSGLGVTRVIASHLARARKAGEAIAAADGLPFTIDPHWRELDFGAWDGLHPSAVEPQALGRFWNDPDAFPPPGGERWSALTGRVGTAIAALGEEPTLVVTHGGAMRAALALLCGFDQRQLWAFDLPYGALLSLRLWRGDRPFAQIAGLFP
ncbi:histidine phosphatase family protein [Sphingomonas naphthae]|uniref:Histidine phosphatase family protein n=1 Tax=Sphingomonas naphthae TaxID=1813468 RepID=A0ABY7TJ62_9SPHN|nr:histidine phosphatase family protein [Sphingomonas naphthae]WCT72359.1 histidine phosphatase family protein [Sphingomonas naphthae]